MLTRLITRLRADDGFTLVEALVAIVTGVIVTGALFTILDFSVKQSSRLSQVAQATQVSRTAMTKIVDQLHSACLSAGFQPIQAESTPSRLIFITGYSEADEIPYTSVHREELEYVVTSGKGVLKEKGAIGASEPSFRTYTFGAPKTTVIAENISPYQGSEADPIFKYYEYATTNSTGSEEPASTLKEIPVAAAGKLSATEAQKVASVAVSFRTAPYTREVQLTTAAQKGTYADLSTQTTFALGSPNSEATIKAGPCE